MVVQLIEGDGGAAERTRRQSSSQLSQRLGEARLVEARGIEAAVGRRLGVDAGARGGLGSRQGRSECISCR
jgi:hypothetical protein